jgi:hypothetical protein
MKYFSISFLILLSVILNCCKPNLKEKGTSQYITEVKEWHKQRIENLKKENGWLNLIGLFWLKEGVNSFGSDKTNDILFPENISENFMGVFELMDSIVTIKVMDGIKIINEGNPIEEMKLRYDLQGKPTVLEYKSLRWNVIKRGEKFGIRLRNLDAELVKSFPGIETYPIKDDWKIEALFEQYNPPKEISIPTVIGTIEKEKSPGALIFTKDGIELKLDVTDAGKSYFVIFADRTNGNETYGAGRFLSVDKPDSSGKIFIDFNKAYNPPCAFTKYATCPLPPAQNHLKIEITAGEKIFGEGH